MNIKVFSRTDSSTNGGPFNRELYVNVVLPVKAEQRNGDGEAGISNHLNQPGQTFSSQTAQQRTDALQRPRQEGQGWGTHLLRPQRPPHTTLVLRRKQVSFFIC